MLSAIVTDIEGTTTPIRFVTDVLYPYARARIPDLVREPSDDADVARILDEVRGEVSGPKDLEAVTAQLLAWMDADRKVAPLKDLQGILWEAGYRDGELVTEMYPDAAAGLQRWHANGLRLYVYSSGSVRAQRAIFSHTDAGDLAGLFTDFFDTHVGHKREPGAYRQIVAAIGVAPEEVLFLSDVREELDAARQAGMQTAWLVRDRMPPGVAAAHRRVTSFDRIRL